jgi:ketosteroid isomerase-like protein
VPSRARRIEPGTSGPRESGDRVLILLLLRVRGAQSGVAVRQHAFHVWEIRDGKVVRLQLFIDRERALEAVGLRE